MKIAIIGYGKMGKMIYQIAVKRGHQVVCIIDAIAQNTDSGESILGQEGFLTDAFRQADIAIEFTTPTTAEQNIRKCWEQHIPVVSGTTGWNVNALQQELQQHTPVIKHHRTPLTWKSNYSIGVQVLFELNRILAEKLRIYPQYTPAISETHHIHKLDKPSGTAKTLAEDIVVANPNVSPMAIQSIREGEIPGIHIVTWDSPEDTITLSHSAKGREGLALGAIIEAERVINDNNE
mgnify:CR=1 FL=1